MLALGLDLGASSVKLALLENGKIKSLWMQTHQGRPFEYLQNGLEMLNLHEKAAVCVTGANSEALLAACPELTGLGDIPATVEGSSSAGPAGRQHHGDRQPGRAVHHGLAKRRAAVFRQRALRGRYGLFF